MASAYFTSALTAKQAVTALDTCLNTLSPTNSLLTHLKLFTDRGSDMGSKVFQKFLAQRNIHHYVSPQGSRHHSGQVERLIREIIPSKKG